MTLPGFSMWEQWVSSTKPKEKKRENRGGKQPLSYTYSTMYYNSEFKDFNPVLFTLDLTALMSSPPSPEFEE